MATTSSDRNVTNGDGQKIEAFFNFSRWPSGLKLFILCVYLPIGIILAILRLIIGLHLFIASLFLRYSDTGRHILRTMSIILGIVVLEEGEHYPSRVVVSNHVSPFDYIAVALTRRVVLPTSWDLPDIIQRILGVMNLGMRNGRETLIKNAKNYCGSDVASSQPLLAFPEGAMTNGKIGLLKFNNWPFALTTSVQPVIVRLQRPEITDVAATTVGSGLLADTFWLLCVPYTVFTLQWLPEMQMEPDDTPEMFTRRVERLMAEKARLQTTGLTSHDAFEFAKRHLSARTNNLGRSAHPYDRLVSKVKEIVPQVPPSAILTDLERTGGSIDATIANILEGRVPYTPEKVEVSSSSGQKPIPKVSSNDPSSWRELYDLRKRELLDTERRKYIARKGYPVPR